VKSAVAGEGIPAEEEAASTPAFLSLGLRFFLFSSLCLVASTAFSCKHFFLQKRLLSKASRRGGFLVYDQKVMRVRVSKNCLQAEGKDGCHQEKIEQYIALNA
jgi:hypothetical protein